MTALESLATDPRLKQNVLSTTQNIAETTATLAALTKDLRTVTGDPQTQAQMRSTIANLDAVMQKANCALGAARRNEQRLRRQPKRDAGAVDGAEHRRPIPARFPRRNPSPHRRLTGAAREPSRQARLAGAQPRRDPGSLERPLAAAQSRAQSRDDQQPRPARRHQSPLAPALDHQPDARRELDRQQHDVERAAAAEEGRLSSSAAAFCTRRSAFAAPTRRSTASAWRRESTI